MKDAKPAKTPMGTNEHLDLNAGGKSVDQKVYRSMILSLLYIWASSPDIMLSVCIYAIFQSDLKEYHLVVVKRIFRYLVHMPYIRLSYTQALAMPGARLIRVVPCSQMLYIKNKETQLLMIKDLRP
jgi:hypothetical protein